MSETTVYETLVAVFRDELAIDPARVHPGAALIGELGFDSIAFAIGLVSIEEQLGVTLRQEELIVCKTVADVVQLIERTCNRVAPAAAMPATAGLPAP
ncbi:Acyl carrier protein [Lysobacter sp. yr284]|uniref:acyl carrier protein n=1 Tax=Lysobacter TaxID=68 RepID=UPI0008995F50|nr:acyl carrier protein [Lysobacter sp. yr284]SDY96651.1 Acyl carrier protein [Lysobacter sp. yr284]